MSKPLKSAGQIKQGDAISVRIRDSQIRCNYVVDEVLNQGVQKEQVILDERNNIYFITSMAIDGSSWARDVEILE